MWASEFSLLQERVRQCRSHRGCCHLWETDKIRSNFALQVSGRIWRTTWLQVEGGVTCRTVVIRLFRLRVLYSELVCPLFILRTLPLYPSLFADKILPHAPTLPFFANDGTISLASLCGICGGRSDSRICFCASIAVFSCHYSSNSAPCSYSFVCRWQILAIDSITEKQLLSPDRSTSCRSQRLHIGSHMRLISRLFSLVINYAVQSVTVCANCEHSFCFVHLTGGVGV